MGISVEQYRACIGNFYSICVLNTRVSLFRWNLNFAFFFDLLRSRLRFNARLCRFKFLLFQFHYTVFSFFLILLSGDIETNPGPRVSIQGLSVCLWNLNSIWVDDFAKIAQISAFLSTHNFDIFCICESFLDSSIEDDDPGLSIDGYEILRSDHPSNSRRGGVCIFFKSHLPLVRRKELEYLDECLVCELKTGSDRFLFCLCYRSPSQDVDQFNVFQYRWEESIKAINDCSPTTSIFLGDFNARNSDWWAGDITNSQGRDLADLAAQYNLHQIIDEPTHLLPDSLSCIDLIFSSTRDHIIDSGVMPSLYPRCHHQLVYAKFNFKTPFPPAYQRRIWDFSRADINAIKRSVNLVDWDRVFSGLDLDQKVSVLTEFIFNIFSNLVPNRIITIRNKDALWMTAEIKRFILEKARIYRRYVKNGRNAIDKQCLQEITFRCREAIKLAKEAYQTKLSSSLNDPNIGPKKYWSTLNNLIHKRKITRIPPIRNTSNNIVTDVSEKANVFNTFFAQQCSLIDNMSVLPPPFISVNHRLDSVNFAEDKILAFIRALNVHKAHGWDNISTRMVKICEESLLKPLMNIFNHSLATGKFPNVWKKGNVVPVHKKGDKSVVKNYRPVSLLPIFSKIFEKCIYDTLYCYFEDHNLFSTCQSGFRKNDSCISQLLSITHKIFKGFDANPTLDTRGVFLDISKAFDRVWHEGLLHKLQSYGVSGNLLSLMRDFLSGRVQRVTLNGYNSMWKRIEAGVPQGSILGPLLFLIFINDLPENLESVTKIFADDTSLFSLVVDQNESSNSLNRDLGRISEWAYQWKMSFNPDPSKQAVGVYFSRKGVPDNAPVISFNNSPITFSESHKHLGLILDEKLTFDHHLREKIKKANRGIGLINKIRKFLSRDTLLTIFKAYVRPHLDYGDIIYDNPGNTTLCSKLESIQYNACLAITGCIRGTSREKLYSELGLESLADRRYSRRLFLFYNIVKGKAPQYLLEILPPQNRAFVNLRSRLPIYPMYARTERFRQSFFPYCITQWNNLDSRLRDLPSISRFKRAMFEFLRPKASPTFRIQNYSGLVLLTRLRVGFSHLREHKFRHGFLDTLDPFCSCRTNSIEDTIHFLLHCSNFSNERLVLFDNLRAMNISLFPLTPQTLCKILLFGDSGFHVNTNHDILNHVITFISDTDRFSGPLFV